MDGYAPGSAGLMTPIMPFLASRNVSELLINNPGEVWVEQGGEMSRHEVPRFTEFHLLKLFRLIANENDQALSMAKPLLSGQLYDGTRVQLVMPPTAKYPTMSVRRKVVSKRTLSHYNAEEYYQMMRPCNIKENDYHGLPDDDQRLVELYQQGAWHAFIQFAIMAKKNIVISGGTSSGKTTYLNACLAHIPLCDRIIILEDTREIETAHP